MPLKTIEEDQIYRGFIQSSFTFFSAFPTVIDGLLHRCTCEISPRDSGSVPSGVSGAAWHGYFSFFFFIFLHIHMDSNLKSCFKNVKENFPVLSNPTVI